MRASHILVDPGFKLKLKQMQLDLEQKENRKISTIELTRKIDINISDDQLEINRWKKRGGKFEISL